MVAVAGADRRDGRFVPAARCARGRTALPAPASSTAPRSPRRWRSRTRTSSSSAPATRPARRRVYLARYARSVTMLVRGESLADSMSRYLIERIAADRQPQRPVPVGDRRAARRHRARGDHDRRYRDRRDVARSRRGRCSSSSAPRRAPNGSRERWQLDPQGFILSGRRPRARPATEAGSRLAAEARAVVARDQRPRHLRCGRRPPSVDQAHRLGGRRRRDGADLRPPASADPGDPAAPVPAEPAKAAT